MPCGEIAAIPNILPPSKLVNRHRRTPDKHSCRCSRFREPVRGFVNWFQVSRTAPTGRQKSGLRRAARPHPGLGEQALSGSTRDQDTEPGRNFIACVIRFPAGFWGARPSGEGQPFLYVTQLVGREFVSSQRFRNDRMEPGCAANIQPAFNRGRLEARRGCSVGYAASFGQHGKHREPDIVPLIEFFSRHRPEVQAGINKAVQPTAPCLSAHLATAMITGRTQKVERPFANFGVEIGQPKPPRWLWRRC
jgi:hypothetical protein